MITDSITYNIRERGRKYRGQNRDIDTVALAKVINSPDTQERVRHGDMLGYFGHFVRERFGMRPKESALVDGQVVALPAAIRTVELSADDDGNITHREEFLDTNEGRMAYRIHATGVGGFSSAITPVRGTMPVLPYSFDGFDFVYEPNYSTNRGYRPILDGVEVEEGSAIEAILDDADGAMQAACLINSMFDALQGQHEMAIEAMDAMRRKMERMAIENETLMARIARGGPLVLDSVSEPSLGVAGVPVPDYGRFTNAPLAGYRPLDQDNGKGKGKDSPLLEAAHARYGYSRRG